MLFEIVGLVPNDFAVGIETCGSHVAEVSVYSAVFYGGGWAGMTVLIVLGRYVFRNEDFSVPDDAALCGVDT